MSEAAPSVDARHLEMIEAMTESAFALSMAAGEIAKRSTDDTKLFLAASDEFRRCCFAVRMGIRLNRAIRAGVIQPLAAKSHDEERPEPAEAPERPERGDARERLETERERDYEPVSLPRFLKSLGLVAANAEKRRDDLPPHIRDHTLPTLQNLLQQANASPDGEAPSRAPPSAVAVLTRPAAAPAARSRLLTSTVTPLVPPLRPTKPRRPSG